MIKIWINHLHKTGRERQKKKDLKRNFSVVPNSFNDSTDQMNSPETLPTASSLAKKGLHAKQVIPRCCLCFRTGLT